MTADKPEGILHGPGRTNPGALPLSAFRSAGAGPAAARPLTRRSFLGAAAATAGAATFAGPLLAACGSAGTGTPGAASASQLAKIMPTYVPSSVSQPDFASVDGSAPGYLSYPSTLPRSVASVPGDGGSYTAITPLWASIPSPSGNTYYEAVNKALNATLSMQPANGDTYSSILPPLFSGNKLPDWIQVPSFWTAPLNFGQATAARFADLTPYLAGDNIKKYPNLAAIFPGGWQAGVWNDNIYGIPSYSAQFTVAYYLYYRSDVFDKLGIGTPKVTSISDLYDLGKEINNPSGKVWAFDDIWGYLYQPFGITTSWTTNDKGDLITQWETPEIIDAMVWEAKLVKAGLMNPDSVAGDTGTAKQRFWSGEMLITADGPGAWVWGDAVSGTAANSDYVRMAFPFFTASGTGTPSYALANGTTWLSYLSKDLSPSQIEELLRIANYLAAPFGSYEYTLVNYGAASTDYTMSSTGPVLTSTGNKQVATTYQFLTSPNSVNNQPGYPDVTRASAVFSQQNARYGYKPPFYDMNISVPASLSSANAFTPFSGTTPIQYEVVRGRGTVADYQSTVKTWLSSGGGNQLKKYYESVRAKYGDA
jgi:putative aldouronate transport system substrate-binding protein